MVSSDLRSCWGHGIVSSPPELLLSRPDRSVYKASEPGNKTQNMQKRNKSWKGREILINEVKFAPPHPSFPLGSGWTGSSAAGHRLLCPGPPEGAVAGGERLGPKQKNATVPCQHANDECRSVSSAEPNLTSSVTRGTWKSEVLLLLIFRAWSVFSLKRRQVF